jgi:hypothetical protein
LYVESSGFATKERREAPADRPAWQATIDSDNCVPAALGLLEQLMGLPIKPGWFGERLRTYRIPPVHRLYDRPD